MKTITRQITITLTSKENEMLDDFDVVIKSIQEGNWMGFDRRDDSSYQFEIRDLEGNLAHLDSW